MRTTKVISITMPPALADEVAELAKRENRTTSELFREAFRNYQRQRRWDEINAYGRAKAFEAGIAEEDVVSLVREYRREQRGKSKTRQAKRSTE